MARINGLQSDQVNWLTRLVYWFTRRTVARLTGSERLVEPVKVLAHHPRLLRAYGRMEMGQEAAHTVPAALKTLASLMTDMLIGCPY